MCGSEKETHVHCNTPFDFFKYEFNPIFYEENLEAIILTKHIQHNGQKKMDKATNNDLQRYLKKGKQFLL